MVRQLSQIHSVSALKLLKRRRDRAMQRHAFAGGGLPGQNLAEQPMGEASQRLPYGTHDTHLVRTADQLGDPLGCRRGRLLK